MPVRGAGGGGGGNGGGETKAWPKGTRWAYFKGLPASLVGHGGTDVGNGNRWVRVGSITWKNIVAYNANSHATRGSQQRTTYHPSAKATQQYSPGSVLGKDIYQRGVNNKQNPGSQGFTNGGKTGKGAGDPPKSPPKTPPKDDPKQPNYGKYFGNPNTQSMIPMKDAKIQAQLQYGAQIHDASQAKSDQIAQAAQNLTDINNWYNHIQKLNTQAGAAGQQATNQETTGNNADVQAALAAIGGGANKYSGDVAEVGLQGNRFARQMNANQQAYLDGNATALAQNEDAQKAAQRAVDSQTTQSLDSNLQNLLGQRGQAITANQMAIIAANNAARQGNFGNRISKAQSIAGLLQLGLNAKMTQAQLNAAGGGGNHGHIPFYKQTPTQQQATLAMLLQGGKDAQGHDIAVPLAVAAQRAKQYGYDAAPGTVLWKLLGTYTH